MEPAFYLPCCRTVIEKPQTGERERRTLENRTTGSPSSRPAGSGHPQPSGRSEQAEFSAVYATDGQQLSSSHFAV